MVVVHEVGRRLINVVVCWAIWTPHAYMSTVHVHVDGMCLLLHLFILDEVLDMTFSMERSSFLSN